MKRFIFLFTLFISLQTSAQDINELQKQAYEMQKQSMEMYKSMMPTYADTLGIFAIKDNKLERIDPVKYQQTKAGLSPFTSSSKLVFPNNTSRVHFKGIAKFRLYFGHAKPQDIQRFFAFGAEKTLSDFNFVKFKVKGNTRRLKTFSTGFFGIGASGSIGVESSEDLNIKTNRLRDGLYEIEVSGPAGEYGIAPIINGNTGFLGVYDFTIE